MKGVGNAAVYRSKKDIDRHVQEQFNKLSNEHEVCNPWIYFSQMYMYVCIYIKLCSIFVFWEIGLIRRNVAVLPDYNFMKVFTILICPIGKFKFYFVTIFTHFFCNKAVNFQV